MANIPKYFYFRVNPTKAGIELEDASDADVVEVVRCKDCRYWYDAPADDGFNSCEMDALIRHEGFFCANGERREGDTDG